MSRPGGKKRRFLRRRFLGRAYCLVPVELVVVHPAVEEPAEPLGPLAEPTPPPEPVLPAPHYHPDRRRKPRTTGFFLDRYVY